MSFAELKDRVEAASEEERLELQAFMFYLSRKDDPEYKAELSRRMAEMDAGKKYTQQEVEKLHRDLLAQGR